MAGARGLLCSTAQAPTSCSLSGNTQLIDTRMVLDFHEAAPTVVRHIALHGRSSACTCSRNIANKLAWLPTLFLGVYQAPLVPRPPAPAARRRAVTKCPPLLPAAALRTLRSGGEHVDVQHRALPAGQHQLEGQPVLAHHLERLPWRGREKQGRAHMCVQWLRATRRRFAGRLGGCSTTGENTVLSHFFKACGAPAGGRAKGTCPLLSVLGPPSTCSRLLSHPLLAHTSPTAATHPWDLHTPAPRFRSSHASHAMRVFWQSNLAVQITEQERIWQRPSPEKTAPEPTRVQVQQLRHYLYPQLPRNRICRGSGTEGGGQSASQRSGTHDGEPVVHLVAR